mmetsp:Transcript_99248/g.296598  ORF Transcript_99248/g.296598 Transcript_99248/m.296598 type:complete len:211 (+) Transcript_99248:101-733(+)
MEVAGIPATQVAPDAVGRARRCADHPVSELGHAATIAPSQRVRDLRRGGRSDRRVHHQGREGAHDVDAQSICSVLADGVVNRIAAPLLLAIGLVGVGQLALEEVHPAGLAPPLDLVLHRMLDGQAVDRHVVPIDPQAIAAVAAVGGRRMEATAVVVVRMPEPGVVQDHALAIDLDVDVRTRPAAAPRGAPREGADPREDVGGEAVVPHPV